MDEKAGNENELQKELNYYKKQLDLRSGEIIRNDFIVSSLRLELKQKKDAFAILANLQQKFTVSVPDDFIFNTTVQALNTQLGMDRTVLLIPSETDGVFTTRYWYGYPEEELPANRQINLPENILHHGQFILCNKSTTANETIILVRNIFQVNFFVGLPITIDEKIIGFIITGRTVERPPFHMALNNSDVDTLKAIASLLSTVFQNKNMLELRVEMKRQLDENKVIKDTLAELKATQMQLIQKEKMASLGELTAGIAHEIQNPLNFINNFSEINIELLQELKVEVVKEASQRDMEMEKDIINSLEQNLDKITHHGKRADGIVKSMLQHSRTAQGEIQLTDLNELCDEYLRLSYHGMRAKEKSFNVSIKTNFEPGLGKLNMIPQDIGRVLLNLFNNAFYSVEEKKRKVKDNYQPTVTVSTKKHNGYYEICVKDNGLGIPVKIKDKIFQPFFTTKPAGDGTGLGLSLSFDIITKGHRGTIKVESTEGEGAEFVVQIPVE